MKYVISDTHFGHTNIIEYCDRPYTSVGEMNEALTANWNRTVDDDDEVIFVGDLTIAGTAEAFLRWIDRLHGEITFIVGDHDDEVLTTLDRVYVCEDYRFDYDDQQFYCVHDPADLPANQSTWAIHGHHHNNWPDQFPFLNPKQQRVNVSVELINYTPLALSKLIALIEQGEWLQTLSDANNSNQQPNA